MPLVACWRYVYDVCRLNLFEKDQPPPPSPESVTTLLMRIFGVARMETRMRVCHKLIYSGCIRAVLKAMSWENEAQR